MSLSWIAGNPRILDPSNPMPSSNMSSLSSESDIEKCCQTPGKSMKRRSMIFTPFSRANSTTSLGFMKRTSRFGLIPFKLIDFVNDSEGKNLRYGTPTFCHFERAKGNGNYDDRPD